MFKSCFQCNEVFKLRICLFIFLCFFLPSDASRYKINETHQHLSFPPKFKVKSKWELAPLGETATDFLSLFFSYSSSGPIRNVIRSGIIDSNKILQTIIGYTFMQQIPMTILVTFGLLCALLLLIMPFFIVLYRNQQISASEEPGFRGNLVSPQQGWLIFEFLIVFVVITVFGGIIMLCSLIELNRNIPEAFDFAVYTVNVSYRLKERIRESYYYNLFDISRSAFETIQRMHDVNEEVEEKFMNEINFRVRPIRFLIQSIQWDVKDVENSLAAIKKKLEFFTSNTGQAIEKLTGKYFASLNNLKETFDEENATEIFGLVVDPLLEIGNYSSNSSFKDFDEAIKRLQAISEFQFAEELQNITRYLRDAVGSITYDPYEVIDELKNISLGTESKIRIIVGEYIGSVESYFTEKLKRDSLANIKSMRIRVLNKFETMYVVFVIFSTFSVALGAIFFISFSLGVIGTKGFRIQFPGLRVHKSGLSDRSGKTIVFFVYFSVIFLASFWAISIIIFISSTIPLELCFSAKDKSLFDVNLDIPILKKTLNYGALLIAKFETFLKEHIEKCEKDPSYFKFLPDPLVNDSLFENVKEELNVTTVHEDVQSAFQNIPYIDISESEISALDIDDIINFDTHSYFRNIVDFIEELNPGNTSSVLKKIKDHRRSSKTLSNAARTTLKSFESLITKLSNSAHDENYFNFSLNALNATVTMITIEIDHFKIASEVLIDFLKQNSSDLYISILNETVIDMIDVVAYNLNSSAYHYRKSISVCSVLTLLYRKFLLITCELLLNPMSATWMGSFFVDIFLLLSILLCLYSVPLFLVPLRENTFTPRSVIHPETIPFTSRDRMGPHISRLETDIHSINFSETPESSESPVSDRESKDFDDREEEEVLSDFEERTVGKSSSKKKLESAEAQLLLDRTEKAKFEEKTRKPKTLAGIKLGNGADVGAKEISETEEAKSLSDILRSHPAKNVGVKSEKNASASESLVIDDSEIKNLVNIESIANVSSEKLEGSVEKESIAEVKEGRSLWEILRPHSKEAEVEQNEETSEISASPDSNSSNTVSSDHIGTTAGSIQEKGETSVDKENVDIKGRQSLRGILRSHAQKEKGKQNENIAPISEPSNGVSCSSVPTESTAEEIQENAKSSVDKENVDIKETRSLHEILRSQSNKTEK